MRAKTIRVLDVYISSLCSGYRVRCRLANLRYQPMEERRDELQKSTDFLIRGDGFPYWQQLVPFCGFSPTDFGSNGIFPFLFFFVASSCLSCAIHSRRIGLTLNVKRESGRTGWLLFIRCNAIALSEGKHKSVGCFFGGGRPGVVGWSWHSEMESVRDVSLSGEKSGKWNKVRALRTRRWFKVNGCSD